MSNRSPLTTEDGVPDGSPTPLTPGLIVPGVAPYYDIAPGVVVPAPHAPSHAAGGSDPVIGPLALQAGTAAPGTAPLKLTSGTLLAAPEAGAVEFLTDKGYLTITTGTARKELALADAALTSGRIPFTTTNGRLSDTADLTRNATTGDITVGGGANIELDGANAIGEGCIIFKAAASASYDTNLCRTDSSAKTMGYVCGPTAAFVGTSGPFFGLRGNTYAAYANQRGNVFIYGGRPSAPGAAEGRVFFGTNDTERLGIDYNGTVKVALSLMIGGGTALTKAVVYTPTLAPTNVSASDEYNEQYFTVTGLSTSDTVIVNPPAMSAAPHCQIICARVSAANTLAITFRAVSGTHAPPQGVYRVLAIRS